MNTTVRQYGARINNWTPALGAAMQQSELRTMYWNALVELDKPIQEYKERLKLEWKATHLGEDSYEEMYPQDTAGKQASKEMWAFIKNDEILKTLYEKRKNGITPTRQKFAKLGLYSFNYIDVERAFTKAISTPDGAQFKRLNRDEGRVVVLFTTGLSTSEIYGQNQTIQFTPVNPSIYESRASRRQNQRTKMKIRVCSIDKKPMFLEVDVFLHRPIPNGIIREVSLNWRTVSRKVQYSVSVVVQTEETLSKLEPAPEGSVVGVNLGWSEYDNGAVRVAYWYGNDGKHGSLDLPQDWVSASNKVNDLESIRKKHMNAIQPALSAWIRNAPGVPEWLREDAQYIMQWKSAKRLHSLEFEWRDNRFHADGAGYVMLSEFVKRDKHLEDYEDNLRQQNLLRRREIFRLFANTLARDYAELRMEKMDLRPFAEKDKLGGDAVPDARKRRQAVAPSEARAALELVFKREARGIKQIKGKTTNQCHACGAVLQTKTRIHKCHTCATQFDIDYNAARVMAEQREPEVIVKPPRVSRRFGKIVQDKAA